MRKFLPTLQKPTNARKAKQTAPKPALTQPSDQVNSAHHLAVEEEITATNERQPPIHLAA